QRHLHIHHRIAGNDAGLFGFANPLVHRRHVLTRHRAADDTVDELVSLAGLIRLEFQPHVTVLAAPTGLAHEFAFALDRTADGLAVSNLRLADVRLDLELALHAVDDDLEVQLAHPGDDGLTRLLVGADTERGVFLGQALQREAHLFLVCLGLRFYGNRDDRRGE